MSANRGWSPISNCANQQESKCLARFKCSSLKRTFMDPPGMPDSASSLFVPRHAGAALRIFLPSSHINHPLHLSVNTFSNASLKKLTNASNGFDPDGDHPTCVKVGWFNIRWSTFVTVWTGLSYLTLRTGNEGRTEVNTDNLCYFHILKFCAKIKSIGWLIWHDRVPVPATTQFSYLALKMASSERY